MMIAAWTIGLAGRVHKRALENPCWWCGFEQHGYMQTAVFTTCRAMLWTFMHPKRMMTPPLIYLHAISLAALAVDPCRKYRLSRAPVALITCDRLHGPCSKYRLP